MNPVPVAFTDNLSYCSRADDEILYEILDAWETVFEKTGFEIPADDVCRAFCRLDLVLEVKTGMERLRQARGLINGTHFNQR